MRIRFVANIFIIFALITSVYMKEPFDIEIHGITYSVFPEETDTYTIFKEGVEYIQITKDTDTQWLKLDPESGIPLFGMDEEVNLIGQAIVQQSSNH